MKNYFVYLGLAGFLIESGNLVHAQVSDIALPRVRDAIVVSATDLVEERGKSVVAIEQPANPFEWPAEVSDEPTETIPVVRVPPAMDADALARIAARIPATGTVNLGGQFILLLGQKRLKVGDVVTISFEGQSYELIVADIASTSFTVRRGSLSHTRATHLSN